jgi:hypothetical protein
MAYNIKSLKSYVKEPRGFFIREDVKDMIWRRIKGKADRDRYVAVVDLSHSFFSKYPKGKPYYLVIHNPLRKPKIERYFATIEEAEREALKYMENK